MDSDKHFLLTVYDILHFVHKLSEAEVVTGEWFQRRFKLGPRAWDRFKKALRRSAVPFSIVPVERTDKVGQRYCVQGFQFAMPAALQYVERALGAA
jgi:hypothetical protein